MMFFGRKKKEDLIVQCSQCEWRPDGEIHWACSCEHRWNTFETKGKCPKCKIQWETTWCPGCGKSTPHKEWYKTKEEIEQIEKSGDQRLRAKKKSLESRLIGYGIKNYRVSHLPYLDYPNESFQSPYDAGCRMMILFAISHLTFNLEDRPQMIEWLKGENLWDKVSPEEREFLYIPSPEENLLMDLSWRIESSLTLGWCLNKVKNLPKLNAPEDENVIETFLQNIPELGEPLMPFLANLEYRSLDEIYEENLLNELATTYFRDLLVNGKKDTTEINRYISFERHKVLNWLRKFYAADEIIGGGWDNTDTST